MIHLDTNYVIGAVTTQSPIESRVLAWLRAGEKFSASAIAWSEYLNGPLTPHQEHIAHSIIEGRIVPFGVREAEMSARLFNHTGRKRNKQPDYFIAATAICAKATLATHNRKDFAHFVPFGLRLA